MPPAPLFSITATGAALGAEVSGVDLRTIDDDVFAAVHKAWLDYQVLLFRRQHLSDRDLIAFSRRFGDLDHAPVQENGRRFVDGHPEIYVVSNVVERGVAIGSLGAGEAVWHTDMSYLANPPKASVLYALEVPAMGGDTAFCTMYGAWEAMPPALQHRLVGLRIKHDATYNSGGYVREGVTPTDDPRTAPGVLHPLIQAHADTGRLGLYLGRRRNAYLEGLPLEESDALLVQIAAQQVERTESEKGRVRRVVQIIRVLDPERDDDPQREITAEIAHLLPYSFVCACAGAQCHSAERASTT